MVWLYSLPCSRKSIPSIFKANCILLKLKSCEFFMGTFGLFMVLRHKCVSRNQIWTFLYKRLMKQMSFITVQITWSDVYSLLRQQLVTEIFHYGEKKARLPANWLFSGEKTNVVLYMINICLPWCAFKFQNSGLMIPVT